jgi:hypothetical protein
MVITYKNQQLLNIFVVINSKNDKKKPLYQ